MTERTVFDVDGQIARHDHSNPTQGGLLDARAFDPRFKLAIALLDAAYSQAFLSNVIFAQGLESQAGIYLSGGQLTEQINGFLNVNDAETITQGRTWTRPNFDGLYVLAAKTEALNQAAGISATTFLNTPGAGLYLIGGRLVVKTASAAGTLTPHAIYTDENGAQTDALLASALTVTAPGHATIQPFSLYLASGSLQYDVAETVPIVGTPAFDLRLWAARIG